MLTLKRVLLSILSAILAYLCACGGPDSSTTPLNFRFGNVWHGEATLALDGMPTVTSPVVATVSDSGDSLGVDGLCGSSPAHLDVSGHGNEAVWRGVLICPATEFGACQRSSLEYNELVMEYDTSSDTVGMTAQVVMHGCDASHNGAMRMIAQPQ